MQCTASACVAVDLDEQLQEATQRWARFAHQRALNMSWGGFKPSGGKPSKAGTGSGATGKGRSRPAKGASKSSSSKSSSGGGGGSGGNDDRTVMNLAYMFLAYMAYTFVADMWTEAQGRQERIDFQTFRNEVLARDVVDKVRGRK